MALKTTSKPRKNRSADNRPRSVVNQLVEDHLIERVSYEEYRDRVNDVYSGTQGALLTTASYLSLHIPLGERLFRTRKFDLRGLKSILDVGSGAGQLAHHLLKYSDPGAQITCVDLSHRMLCRARHRLKSDRPNYAAADLTELPFADASFDGLTCGYVLEHVPKAEMGLAELARVMRPGGRLLLLATEDTFSGAWTSRLWHCRTYNRRELRELSESMGLRWNREIWFTPLHRVFRAGGICVEIVKTG
jgi:ubiquinone/menaquinone biosynthesis C-methylase UbiE